MLMRFFRGEPVQFFAAAVADGRTTAEMIKVYREWLPHDQEAFDKVLELYIQALDVTLNEVMRQK